jgi:carboxyl-terminal processing protease
MPSRVFRAFCASRSFVLAAISLASFGFTSLGLNGLAHGQVRPPTAMEPVRTELRPDINAVLGKGLELERQRKWDEALTHYEETRKQFPSDRTLEQRFHFARMHYDVARRYNDSSFRRLASDLTLQQALALYDEVLLKIDTHYVDDPSARPDPRSPDAATWKRLTDRGTDLLEVALTDEGFGSRNLQGITPERIEGYRAELRRRMDPAVIPGRSDASKAVHWAAWLANKELGLPASAVVMEYVCGAANSLDDYSAFLSGGELKDVYAQIQGNFVGLGIELKGTKEGLLVLRVISGSPAEEAKLQARDVILAVDGRSTLDTTADKAADMLQGPENSTVRVTVQTPGQSPRDVQVTRRRVEVPSVEGAKILDQSAGIAYVHITSFQETTDQELHQALWKLHRQGMKSLIVDVRGNPGGLLRSAVEVVDRFVSRGTIVSTRGRNELENQTYRAQTGESETWHVPMVVLIDEDSASASEIFAGAIRDHQRGTLVGRRSYGKGSVQGIFSLKTADTGIRLTTAKFYSPLGKPFSKIGVDPDVAVPSKRQSEHVVARPTDEGRFLPEQDGDIAKALDVARENMVRRAQRAR